MNANKQLKKLEKISKIDVDPTKYLKRSAGGHIHLGFPNGGKTIQPEAAPARIAELEAYGNTIRNYNTARNPEILVPLLDIVVGNTCVMLDRNENNIERRKVYGRAGEYRQPAHGLEYRTLSNFWLRHPALMSLVCGLSRLAVEIAIQSTKTYPYYQQLMDLVDMDDIEKAINTNDFELAKRNWNKIEDYLMDILPQEAGWYPIGPSNLKLFKHFIDRGLDHWFTKDPLDVWLGKTNESEREGFNGWMLRVVSVDKKPIKKLKATIKRKLIRAD